MADNRIFKYELSISDTQVVTVPVGYKVLSVQTQNGVPCMWCLVDKEEPTTEGLLIRMHGTGHPVEDAEHLEFIATFQIGGGSLVYHVFKDIRGV